MLLSCIFNWNLENLVACARSTETTYTTYMSLRRGNLKTLTVTTECDAPPSQGMIE